MIKAHKYVERINLVDESGDIKPHLVEHDIEMDTKVPKLGILIVGLGGNNGTTVTAGLLANKKNLTWRTKKGKQTANYYGSFTQSSVTKVGMRYDKETNQVENVHKVIKDIVPLVNPNDIVVNGWDISGLNMYESAYRAQVLEPSLIELLKEDLTAITPMPAIFNPDYIASNQSDRADNIFTGSNQECVDKIRKDIADFAQTVEKVVVLWSANTEKFFEEDIKSADLLEKYIKENKPLPGSVLYAYACALEKVIYLNGSPQNTVSEGMQELYKMQGAFIGGADFKTGQTKFKTVMLDFFMGSGLRLASCMSYNHLGNNDGKNLSEPAQFRSKEISKAGVLDCEVAANKVLYPEDNKNIDHTVVIKYCPFVGDSKRAMDEYTAQIFLGGEMTLITHATCEDSLLAAPIMLDLILLAEFFTRVKVDGKVLGPVLSYLSFFFKAPVTNHPEFNFNSFSKQKETLVNFLKACADIMPGDNTLLSIGF